MFPTEIGQRVRVNYETGIPYRGESGFVESVSLNQKEIHVKFSDGVIQKFNKIYLSIELKHDVSVEDIELLKNKAQDFVANGDKNYSISNFCSVLAKFYQEQWYPNFGILSPLEIKELAIQIVKQKNLELMREMIWD